MQYVSNSATATMGILAVRADGDLCCRKEGRRKEAHGKERGEGELRWGGGSQVSLRTWMLPGTDRTEHRKATERAK